MSKNKIKIDKDESNNFFKKLFLLLIFFIILEGAVRKWFIQGYDVQLILLRDGLVLCSIFYGFNKRFFIKDWKEDILFMWTILVVVWSFLQFLINDINPFITLIGIRNWVLYFWFSLLCLRCLGKKELDSILLILLYTIIPIGILVIYQHFMPAGHIINKQIGTTTAQDIFTVAFGVVRTSGTFTFTSGQVQYLAFLTPIIFYLMGGKYNDSMSQIRKIIIIIFFFISIALSGSRGAIMNSGFMLLMFFLISLKLNKMKNILSYLFFGLIFIFFISYFFDNAIEATKFRFQEASDSDLINSRIIGIIFGSSEIWSNFNLFGEGIGIRSKLSKIFINTDFRDAESETTRILYEGGLVGFLFILIKFIFSITVLFKCYKISINTDDIFPFLYSVYMCLQLLMAQITGQVTTHAFTFLGLGILFVILKSYENNKNNFDSKDTRANI
ncbi:O-antigen ligase family protein [Candidatus Pelagibacter sp.]|nr:O-antigen ligase family protein [Candidatus Pelagibacter sp.]